VLGALEQVALAYLERAGGRLPFWRMATVPVDELRARAAALGRGEVVECVSVTGGGTLPGVEIPSIGIALSGDLTTALRAATPKPVIARVDDDQTILDLRTVDPDDDPLLAAAIP
jgi:L-seryl-tRNA(Ser) seleniumtransferase